MKLAPMPQWGQIWGQDCFQKSVKGHYDFMMLE
jgi:hypothetical protein